MRRDHPVLHLAVGGLEEAELVDPGVGGERGDEPDVRTFRGLDRAHPPVVRVVHVADLEAGAVAGEAAGSEGGEPPLVGQLGQRVRLVHELGELAGPEEALDHRRDGAGVDEVVDRDRLRLLQRHPLPDDPRHARQAGVELVGQKLARPSAPGGCPDGRCRRSRRRSPLPPRRSGGGGGTSGWR